MQQGLEERNTGKSCLVTEQERMKPTGLHEWEHSIFEGLCEICLKTLKHPWAVTVTETFQSGEI